MLFIPLQVPLPNHNPAWYSAISYTTLPAITDICKEILRLYRRAKPDAESLEQVVSSLKKAQLEAKARLRGNIGNDTPTQASTGSRPATPSKVSPYSGAEDQKLKGDNLING